MNHLFLIKHRGKITDTLVRDGDGHPGRNEVYIDSFNSWLKADDVRIEWERRILSFRKREGRWPTEAEVPHD